MKTKQQRKSEAALDLEEAEKNGLFQHVSSEEYSVEHVTKLLGQAKLTAGISLFNRKRV